MMDLAGQITQPIRHHDRQQEFSDLPSQLRPQLPQFDELNSTSFDFDTAVSPQFSYLPPYLKVKHEPQHLYYPPSRPSSTFECRAERGFQDRVDRQTAFSKLLNNNFNQSTHRMGMGTYLTAGETWNGVNSVSLYNQQAATVTDFLAPTTPYLAQQHAYNDVRHYNGLPVANGYVSPPETPRFESLPGSPFESSDGFTSEVDSEDNPAQMPYAQLIYLALLSAPGNRMILKDIYKWVKEHSDRADNTKSTGWQNSVRHNLSMNQAFRKIPYESYKGNNNKSGYIWELDEEALNLGGVYPTTRYRKQGNKNRAKTQKKGPRNMRLAKLSRRGGQQSIKAECASPTSSPYCSQGYLGGILDTASEYHGHIGPISIPPTPFCPANGRLLTPYSCPTPAPTPASYDSPYEQVSQLPTSNQANGDLWYSHYNSDSHFDNSTDSTTNSHILRSDF